MECKIKYFNGILKFYQDHGKTLSSHVGEMVQCSVLIQQQQLVKVNSSIFPFTNWMTAEKHL